MTANKKGAEAPSIGDLAFETSCRKFALTCRTLGLRLRAATFDLTNPILARPDAAFNRIGTSGPGIATIAVSGTQAIAMTQGTHEFVDDPRNRDIQIYVNGEMKPRAEATVSVFDSGFVLGDGVWEGLRVHAGRIAFLDQHLDRLYEGAKAIDMDIGLTRDELTRALYNTLAANSMSEHVHIRLMVTRGVKRTPYQDPRMTIGPATIVIIPEYKNPKPETLTRGIRLFTVHVRRGYPDVQDPKLNSHSKLNCITACIQATKAGADEALMLDPHGFVATCNSTHFFIVRKGEVWTSTGMYCLCGITRANVLRVCLDNGIPAFEKSFSLTDVYGADEAFVTGTFAGVAPVIDIDGRSISAGRGPVVERLQNLYRELIASDVASRALPQ